MSAHSHSTGYEKEQMWNTIQINMKCETEWLWNTIKNIKCKKNKYTNTKNLNNWNKYEMGKELNKN